MKVLHNWLKEYCGETLPSAGDIDALLTFHAFEIDGIEKVGEHEVIDVKVLPDRGADALSHRGIAREIATLTGIPLVHDPLQETVSLSPSTDKLKVSIENEEHCSRFAGALIEGIEVKESPEWLKSRLQALGQRSINNVVDATNYVMLSLGQPLHAYDADKFEKDGDVWHFGVRMAKDGKKVTTLTGETYELTPCVQLIVNMKSDTPVGIAGIKGGKSAELTQETTNIILESANFNPQITRKSAQSLKLQTDASKRFENGVSPELVPYALKDVVELIIDIAGGTCAGYVDVYPTEKRNSPVSVTLVHTNALLGLALTKETVEDIFTRLGFSFEQNEKGDGWSVTAPFERTDIVIAEDVIAEVGRVHGYEHIASILPEKVQLTGYNARHFYSEKIREILLHEGFSELITSSFRKKDTVCLLNALASDKGCLRSTLTSNIQEVLDKNIGNTDLLGIPCVQTFEIGTVFSKNAAGNDVVEYTSLAIGVRMKNDYTPKDDARVQELVSKIEIELAVPLNGSLKQGVYECNLSEVIACLPMPTEYSAYVPSVDATYAPYSPYPYIVRDIAFWTESEVGVDELQPLITEEAGQLAVRISLFDTFEKEGRTSYAFRIIFQSFEKTLTDEEVAPCMTKLEHRLKEIGYEVR